MQEKNYWAASNQGSIPPTRGPLPSKTDVLIVGGGYTGLSAALALRKSGIHVTVIDKQDIGGGASSRNGGMALPGLSGDIHALMKQFGREAVQRFFAESVASVDCVEQLLNTHAIDCDFVRSGHLHAAAKPAHLEGLKREQEFYQEHLNHDTRLLGPERVKSEITSNVYYGGLFDPSGAGLHPAKFSTGLAKIVAEAGADLHSFVTARQYTRRQSHYRVSTDQGDIVADDIIIATNGYTQELMPWLKQRIIPFDSYMIASEKLPPDVARSLIPNNRMLSDTKKILYYFRLSPDRSRLLFGGRAKISKAPVREAAPILHRFLLDVFPQLKPYRIEYAWSGRVCFTFDRFPHIGCHEGLYYAAGYCGHGVALATYFGQKLAEMVLGGADATIFSSKEFKTMPLYSGKPWFLPVVQSYYRLLDRLP